jgi:hypothetical protein
LPVNALVPSEENVTIMGDSYPFFPLPSTWDELRGANHSKRAAELGFRMEVETGTLVYAINQAGGDGADPSHAVKELSKRLSKKSDDYTIGISELDRSPAHACGEHLEVRVNGQDDPLSTDKGTIWAVEDTESLQSLQGLWPDRQIALIDQLTDIDRKTIDGLRKLKDKSQNTILGEWPEWEDFLWKLSSPHLDPQQIELAWILLKGRPEPPGDEISKIELVLEEIRDDPPLVVSFSHEGKCIGVKDGMLTTSVEEDDGTLDPSGKTIVYVPKEEETLLFWLSIIGAQEASKLTDKERLDFMVGEVFDDVDGQDRDRAREVKSLIGRAQSHHYTLVFDGPGTAKLIKVVDASPAIYAPRLRPVPHIFQSFPIIHEVDEDDSKYKIHNKDVISHLHNCHSYSEVSSSVPRPDEKKFSAHAALQEATTNILRAIEKIYPRVFEDLSNSLEIHCFMGDQGTGIPIFTTLDGDDFGTDDQEAITSRVQEAHKYEKFEEKLTLYVQEGTKNPSRKFSRLLLQGITETEWYPSLADSLDENPNLKIRIEELFSELLDTNIDEWGDIHDKLENHGLEPHGRPFESNDRAQMAQKMRNEYNGCQICKLITPDGENSPYTKETVKSTITERGGPYRARRKRTFPHGRVLWLCPRHRILWERKCIKLQFMEEAFPDGWVWRSPKNIPEAIRKDAIRNLTSHKANHQSGSDIEISVYDGDVSIGGIQSTQAEWNQKWLTVTDEHASKIFDEMIAFLKEGAA